MWKVQWEGTPEIYVSTIEELDHLLDRVQRGCEASPVLATVEFPSSGESLSIGLGRSYSVLNYVSGSGKPPYWSSTGQNNEEGVVSFNFMGEVSEFPLRRLIPVSLARQAVRDFAQTGVLSKAVEWEEA